MAGKPKKTAEEEEPEAAEAAEPKPKKSRLRLVIIATAALAVIGGAGGAYFYFLRGAKEKPAEVVAAKPPTFYDLPDVLVNLSNAGSERTQYLKVKVVLELADPSLIQQIQPVLPRVLDTFQVFLRELRPSDLEGSAGVYRLKEELTRRVNAAIAPSHINAVLFKEMVVQ
jgi:flagellar FliL protein